MPFELIVCSNILWNSLCVRRVVFLLLKPSVSRSVSTGSAGMSIVGKDQTLDMNGPLVPEKALKSIQVCVFFNKSTSKDPDTLGDFLHPKSAHFHYSNFDCHHGD